MVVYSPILMPSIQESCTVLRHPYSGTSDRQAGRWAQGRGSSITRRSSGSSSSSTIEVGGGGRGGVVVIVVIVGGGDIRSTRLSTRYDVLNVMVIHTYMIHVVCTGIMWSMRSSGGGQIRHSTINLHKLLSGRSHGSGGSVEGTGAEGRR